MEPEVAFGAGDDDVARIVGWPVLFDEDSGDSGEQCRRSLLVATDRQGSSAQTRRARALVGHGARLALLRVGSVASESDAELLVGDRRDDRPQDLGLAVGGVVPVV